MDAVKFIKEYRRMCNKYYCGKECPLYEEPCDTSSSILLANSDLANKIVNIVEQWSQAHPQKTMMQDFFEKFPNAPVDEDGTPEICPKNLGYDKIEWCDYRINCKDCWNRSVDMGVGNEKEIENKEIINENQIFNCLIIFGCNKKLSKK